MACQGSNARCVRAHRCRIFRDNSRCRPGDRLLDVEDRIDSAVAREADAAIRASHANERERSDNVAKAFAAFVTDMDRRVTDLEGKSYRLTDLLCGTLDGQTVVTAVRLIPIGFGEQELDLTTATICVEEK
jgi:hypothetical protein